MSEYKQAKQSVPRRGDLTQGPILRTLVGFSIPTLLSNILHVVGGTISMIWVGQLLGTGAVAATANGNIIMFMAYTFIFGFAMAMTVRAGQYFGAGQIDYLRRVFGTTAGFCMVMAMAWVLAGWIWTAPLLRLLATPGSVFESSREFLQVSFLTVPFMTLGQVITMGMRAIGNARTPFYTMVIQTVVGAALNPLFILGWGPVPAMGIAGAALANVSAYAVGALLMLALVFVHDTPLRLRRQQWAYLLPVKGEIGYVLGKGFPIGFQMLITAAAGMILLGLVNREGMLTTAAYGAILQTWSYVQIPGSSISMGVSAMVAQYIGAGIHDRIGRVTMTGIVLNSMVTVTMTTLLMAFDDPLLALFLGHGSQAIPIAEHIQLLSTWSWILSGVMTVMVGVMRCYGSVILPLIVMFVAQYPARLGFYFLFYPLLGADALWWGYSFGAATAAAMTTYIFYCSNWRSGDAAHERIIAPDVPG